MDLLKRKQASKPGVMLRNSSEGVRTFGTRAEHLGINGLGLGIQLRGSWGVGSRDCTGSRAVLVAQGQQMCAR